jgi:putative membrane protein
MAAMIWMPTGADQSVPFGRSDAGMGSSVAIVSHQYDNGHMDWDSAGGWFMFSMMAVFWLGAIALGWWAIASYNRHHETPRESPLDVARHRYARGEITAEEFERTRDLLSK